MDGYYPVDCGFHNQLEALSTLQRLVRSSIAMVELKVQDQIVDVYAANKTHF